MLPTTLFRSTKIALEKFITPNPSLGRASPPARAIRSTMPKFASPHLAGARTACRRVTEPRGQAVRAPARKSPGHVLAFKIGCLRRSRKYQPNGRHRRKMFNRPVGGWRGIMEQVCTETTAGNQLHTPVSEQNIPGPGCIPSGVHLQGP